jgi:hypothetical protein
MLHLLIVSGSGAVVVRDAFTGFLGKAANEPFTSQSCFYSLQLITSSVPFSGYIICFTY